MKILKSTISLSLALIMSVIFGINSFATDLCTVYVNGTIQYDKAFQCLEIVNSERAKYGLAPLAMDNNLMQIAIDRAFEANLYFSHKRPDGSSTKYWENIASGYSSPQDVMNGWLSSPGHRDNILNPNHAAVGIACVNGVWVQEFSGRYSQQASRPANRTEVRAVSCDSSSMYMESPYRYKPANLSVGDKIKLLAPKLYLYNQLCYAVDLSSYEISTSDSSIATVNNDFTLSTHKGGDFSVIYTIKGTNISTSVELSVEGAIEEEKPSDEPKNINECNITLGNSSNFIYSGKPITPSIVIKDGKLTLINGTDYTVHYENNIDAGCASAYITGIGGYSGIKTLLFDIYPKVISFDDVKLEYYECFADGTPKRPKFIFTNVNLKEGIDYITSYKNNVKSGIGIAYYETKNQNYVGWAELYFNINDPSSNADDSSSDECVVYSTETVQIELEYNSVIIQESGKRYEPRVVSVKTIDGVSIPSNAYTVEYSANFYAGTAKVKISSNTEKFYGWARTTFDILPKDLADCNIKLEKDTYEASYNPVIPTFSVDNDAFKLGDYSYTVDNNTEPGTGKLTVYASGRNLKGSQTVYFTIKEKNYSNIDTGISSNNTEEAGCNYSIVQDNPEIEAEVIIEPEKKAQSINVPKTTYSKATDSKPFYLNAKAETKLTYKSSNSKVVTVNSNGKVTIKGIGKATITITAAGTDNYEKMLKK